MHAGKKCYYDVGIKKRAITRCCGCVWQGDEFCRPGVWNDNALSSDENDATFNMDVRHVSLFALKDFVFFSIYFV